MQEIFVDNNYYPLNLKKIKNRPEKLYIRGNEKILNNISISVIGSRSHSEYGEKMCKKFTKELVERGIVIVSGMAMGIDSIAHSTCIENGGKTIAVLPSGLDNVYPKKNIKLYNNIINSEGAVISEYSCNIEATKKNFLERNRIVSALSIGTLVIEAGYRSGTSVTARIATEQGKKVFAIPSNLDNKKGYMSNKIIQRGAKLVTSVEDILNEYPEIQFNKVKNEINRKVKAEYRDVYNIILDKPIYINEICKKLKKSVSEINYILMMLEIDGYIIQLPGKEFIRK